jgi:hypothetical protein
MLAGDDGDIVRIEIEVAEDFELAALRVNG